jgi:hypothetical protein
MVYSIQGFGGSQGVIVNQFNTHQISQLFLQKLFAEALSHSSISASFAHGVQRVLLLAQG